MTGAAQGRLPGGSVVVRIPGFHASPLLFVLDPNGETWGTHAWVSTTFPQWWAKVWASRACNVVCEEAGSTIKRDAEVIELFTRAGHNGYRVFVCGHTSASLLPVMREQLTELYLFRQSTREAEQWAELFAEPRVLEACSLNYEAFEFMPIRLGGEPRRCVGIQYSGTLLACPHERKCRVQLGNQLRGSRLACQKRST